MLNLQELPQEIKNLVIASYYFGYEERECKLQPFNGESLEKDKLQWLQDCLLFNEIEEKQTNNNEK